MDEMQSVVALIALAQQRDEEVRADEDAIDFFGVP